MKCLAGAGAACVLGEMPQARGADNETMILSAPLTHSDWMLKPHIAWGEAGVRHMLDACKACGWSHVYWRVFDAGRATYRSKLLDGSLASESDSFYSPQSEEDRALVKKYFPGLTPERIRQVHDQQARLDYSTFDSLACAIDYGHAIGLKIHAWATINEDDHGWGWRSRFAAAHPEYRWVRRDGRSYHSQLSFAFEAVRTYKLALIDELLSQYDLDGLFIDWIRTGDVRDNPQTDADGVADSGYERPNVEAFQKQFSLDPHDVPNGDDRWVRLRAEPQTQFMRGVSQRVKQHPRPLPVCVMVGHPWHYRGLLDPIDGNLRGLLLDVKTWAREGLINAAIPAGYYRAGGSAEKAFAALKEETENAVDVWYYGWVPQAPADFDRDFSAAQRLKAARLLFWEADYIDDRANAADLEAAMSARAAWPAPPARS